MAKSTIINPMEEQHRQAALNQPHNLFVADEILLVDLDAFTATISLGMKNPAGVLSPVFTVKMPVPFALELSKAISEQAQAKKDQFASDLDAFIKTL